MSAISLEAVRDIMQRGNIKPVTLHLNPADLGYSLTLPDEKRDEGYVITFSYAEDSVLRCLQNGTVPDLLCHSLASHKDCQLFYNGCLLLKIKDRRHLVDASTHPTTPDGLIGYALLRPSQASLTNDFNRLVLKVQNELGEKLTRGEVLAFEQQFYAAIACAEPLDLSSRAAEDRKGESLAVFGEDLCEFYRHFRPLRQNRLQHSAQLILMKQLPITNYIINFDDLFALQTEAAAEQGDETDDGVDLLLQSQNVKADSAGSSRNSSSSETSPPVLEPIFNIDPQGHLNEMIADRHNCFSCDLPSNAENSQLLYREEPPSKRQKLSAASSTDASCTTTQLANSLPYLSPQDLMDRKYNLAMNAALIGASGDRLKTLNLRRRSDGDAGKWFRTLEVYIVECESDAVPGSPATTEALVKCWQLHTRMTIKQHVLDHSCMCELFVSSPPTTAESCSGSAKNNGQLLEFSVGNEFDAKAHVNRYIAMISEEGQKQVKVTKSSPGIPDQIVPLPSILD